MENKRTKALGMFIVLAAAIIWGSTGVAGEYLINQRGLDSAWITTYRTTFGGLVMLIILSFKMKGELFKVWKNKKDAIQMVIFGTMISYCIYLVGVTMIGPSRASMLSSIEPVATAVLAALLLATPLVFMDYVGVVLITICILVLAIPSKTKPAEPVKAET